MKRPWRRLAQKTQVQRASAERSAKSLGATIKTWRYHSGPGGEDKTALGARRPKNKGPAKFAGPVASLRPPQLFSTTLGQFTQFLATSGFGASYRQILKLMRRHAWTEAGPQPTSAPIREGAFFLKNNPEQSSEVRLSP
jgi:hypothetical protein